jgi:protein-S-isoprenylcysteine O-methyltransferase Ste14
MNLTVADSFVSLRTFRPNDGRTALLPEAGAAAKVPAVFDYFIGPTGVFHDTLAALLFTALQFAFMSTEARRSRRAPADAARVRPPFPSVLFAILSGLIVRLALGFGRIGALDGDARVSLFWVGTALVLAGWGVRIWAQRALGKFFTGEVAVQRDHRVIVDGPYRWVRHPSYTGGVLAAIGFGLMLSTWLGALYSGVILIWAYVLRVPREERLLASELGDAYSRYVASTKRFVPFLF